MQDWLAEEEAPRGTSSTAWTSYPENIILHEKLPWGSANPACHKATMSLKGQSRQSQWRTGVQNHQRGTQMHICRNGTLGVVLLPRQCLLTQASGAKFYRKECHSRNALAVLACVPSIGVQVIFILESRSSVSLKRKVTVRSASHSYSRCCFDG